MFWNLLFGKQDIIKNNVAIVRIAVPIPNPSSEGHIKQSAFLSYFRGNSWNKCLHIYKNFVQYSEMKSFSPTPYNDKHNRSKDRTIARLLTPMRCR